MQFNLNVTPVTLLNFGGTAQKEIEICFNRGKKGNNYLPIKEDETNGDRKKHLTYLGWKTK